MFLIAVNCLVGSPQLTNKRDLRAPSVPLMRPKSLVGCVGIDGARDDGLSRPKFANQCPPSVTVFEERALITTNRLNYVKQSVNILANVKFHQNDNTVSN